MTEFWLSGPIAGIPPLLQPVAHALLQSEREVLEAVTNFPAALLWEKPAGMASVGFHLEHIAGVTDRLLTYARGEQLTEAQLLFLTNEGKEKGGETVQLLMARLSQAVEVALAQLKQTDEQNLLDPRGVGRKQIPSNVMGLLFHAAEHAQRHTGQLLVTAKFVTNSHS